MSKEEKQYYKALRDWKKAFNKTVDNLIKQGRAMYYGVSKEDIYAYEDWSADNLKR